MTVGYGLRVTACRLRTPFGFDTSLSIIYNTIMKICVVLDTNVILSGLQSQKGASYQILCRLGEQFDVAVSVPLLLEYEEILKEKLDIFTPEDIDGIIDDFCNVGVTAKIHYLWRPFLPDSEDDHILELAIAAHCSYIVTYNKRDFRGVEEKFGIKVIDAAEFLMILKHETILKQEEQENDNIKH